MKKCYSLLRWPCLLQDVLNRRLLFKTNRQRKCARKPSPIISSFLELGRRKLSMQPKFVAAQKMLLKQKPTNIRKWIARFLYFRHLYRWKHRPYYHNNCMGAHQYGQLYLLLLINILLGSFRCFSRDQPLSEGEIIPFSGVCQSGGHYPRRRRDASRTDGRLL